MTKFGLILAALSCVQLAEAQQAAKQSPKLKAFVQLATGGPAQIELERGDGNGNFFYMQKGTDQLMQAKATSCKMFYIQTPADMANALRDYYGGDMPAARKDFASIKKKYASYAGLPGSPCTMAALYELTCAVRMLDIPAVKALSASLPGESALAGSDAARLAAAKVVGMITDKADSFPAIKAAVVEITKTHGKNLDSECYGWLRYALARGAASVVPAEQLQSSIAKEMVEPASVAVDFYCQSIMSMHGAQKGMPADALNRAISLLWAMPGVKDYAAKMTPPLDKQRWNAAPADFRDAVTTARYAKMVYPDAAAIPGSLVDKLDTYYFNAKKGVKKD